MTSNALLRYLNYRKILVFTTREVPRQGGGGEVGVGEGMDHVLEGGRIGARPILGDGSRQDGGRHADEEEGGGEGDRE